MAHLYYKHQQQQQVSVINVPMTGTCSPCHGQRSRSEFCDSFFHSEAYAGHNF